MDLRTIGLCAGKLAAGKYGELSKHVAEQIIEVIGLNADVLSPAEIERYTKICAVYLPELSTPPAPPPAPIETVSAPVITEEASYADPAHDDSGSAQASARKSRKAKPAYQSSTGFAFSQNDPE